MKDESPLSRLEKLGKEHLNMVLKREGGPGQHCNAIVVEAFQEGGKATLQILSEPGEACGPRVFIDPHLEPIAVGLPAGYYYRLARDRQDKWNNCTEFCEIGELLQARAAHEVERQRLQKTIDYLAEAVDERDIALGKSGIEQQLGTANAALASSEARVRLLEKRIEDLLEERS